MSLLKHVHEVAIKFPLVVIQKGPSEAPLQPLLRVLPVRPYPPAHRRPQPLPALPTGGQVGYSWGRTALWKKFPDTGLQLAFHAQSCWLFHPL